MAISSASVNPSPSLSVARQLIVTCRDEVATQSAALATVAVNRIGPVGPALNRIERVPWPLMMTPLVMPQSYNAPAPASATDARWFVVLPHTLVGAVMLTTARSLTTTLVDWLTPQPPPLTTDTPRVIGGAEEAAQVSVRVLWPLRIVPFVMVQE